MVKKKPKISIVIPVYNSEKTIEKCLTSVIKSSFKDIEIIVVNDGSKDSSEDIILNNFDDKRIKYIKQKNGGQSAARNKGLFNATGEYIMFMDSDDYFDTDYLERMYNKITLEKADCVLSSYKHIDENYNIASIDKLSDKLFDIYSMLMPWGKLTKKSLLDENNIKFEDVNYWEDHIFSFAIYSYAKKVVVDSDNTGYNYYYNLSGLTKNNFVAFKVDLIPTHEVMLKKINPKHLKAHKDFWNYMFLKSTICHLLDSGKTADIDLFLEKDKIVFDWYTKNICKLNEIKYPKEEYKKKVLVMKTYLFLRKIGLLKLFLRIYLRKA